jgi:hypothetical protein
VGWERERDSPRTPKELGQVTRRTRICRGGLRPPGLIHHPSLSLGAGPSTALGAGPTPPALRHCVVQAGTLPPLRYGMLRDPRMENTSGEGKDGGKGCSTNPKPPKYPNRTGAGNTNNTKGKYPCRSSFGQWQEQFVISHGLPDRNLDGIRVCQSLAVNHRKGDRMRSRRKGYF